VKAVKAVQTSYEELGVAQTTSDTEIRTALP